jgi:hypothetical protein
LFLEFSFSPLAFFQSDLSAHLFAGLADWVLTTPSFSGASDLALPRFTSTITVLRRIVAFF